MRVAYFDCFAGISGDMALGALLDAGADHEALVAGLRSLGLPDWELRVRKTTVNSLAATDVEVIVGQQPAGDAPTIDPPHSHPHDHGHLHPHDHDHSEPPDHPHPHPSTPSTPSTLSTSTPHHSPPTTQPTRSLSDIRALIEGSALPTAVREQGERVFTRLAEAEARVHDVPVEQVHFHEVGAVDSIVDIIGSVYALHLLGVEEVVASPLPCGHGFIRAAHGLLPVPAPATAELLKGIPVRSVDVEGELVTPTGAALLAALAARFGPMPSLRTTAIGYGAGKRRFAFPNMLRVVIGDAEPAVAEATEVTLLEANLDDLSPQLYEHVMERLLAAGALDVYLQPVLMKKNRPAQILSVLCDPARSPDLAEILFRETTTLGVRESRHHRRCLRREHLPVTTPYGEVRVKIGWLGDDPVTLTPEYEDCRALARERGVPLKEIQAAALCAARARLAPR